VHATLIGSGVITLVCIFVVIAQPSVRSLGAGEPEPVPA
jgi:hypothetical protein